ncbi:MAG: NAD-dependent epimerase/dehydratase family protein [Anaerolineales bacterium]
MRVFIAGGTGFIGTYLSRFALERGWQVTLIVRDLQHESARWLETQGAFLVEGDITDREGMASIFQDHKPNVYIHNAGWYELGISSRQRAAMQRVNVDGLENALAAAEAAGVDRIVLTSSTTALGDTGGEQVSEGFRRIKPPLSWYESTLVEARKIADRYIARGLPLILGCPAQVIGPGDHSAYGQLFRLYLRRLLPPAVWAPDGAFSFVHVEDTARALVELVEKGTPGEEYFICGSVMTNREMLSTWAEALGRRTRFLWLSYPLAMATGLLAAPFLRLLGKPAFISTEVVRSSYASFRYDGEKVQQTTGVKLRRAPQAWTDTIQAERKSLLEKKAR